MRLSEPSLVLLRFCYPHYKSFSTRGLLSALKVGLYSQSDSATMRLYGLSGLLLVVRVVANAKQTG